MFSLLALLLGARIAVISGQRQSVWPDERIKVANILPKVAQKVATLDFIQKVTLLKWPKMVQDVSAIISGKLVTKTFQK